MPTRRGSKYATVFAAVVGLIVLSTLHVMCSYALRVDRCVHRCVAMSGTCHRFGRGALRHQPCRPAWRSCVARCGTSSDDR